MTPWETRPGLGRYGAILLSPQTAVGTPATVPTHTLKATGFMPPLEQLIRTKDDGANGTIRNRRSRVQGVMTDGRQITVEMTFAALVELMKSVGPFTAGSPGTIVPSANNYDLLAPGVPFTIWQLHPTGDRIAQDVQIGAISLTIPARGNVTATITLNTTSTLPLTGTPPVAALPGDQLQFKHFWLKVDGVLYKPETGGINLTVPMGVVDGANGTNPALANYPIGWERTDSPMLGINFTLPGLIPVLRTAYEQNTLVAIQAGFTLPGAPAKTITFDVTTAEVNSVNVPAGMERIAIPYETVGVSEDTLPEFTIKVA